MRPLLTSRSWLAAADERRLGHGTTAIEPDACQRIVCSGGPGRIGTRSPLGVLGETAIVIEGPGTLLHLRNSLRSREKTDAHGQTLVEFAIVFPLFWTVLMGLIEFSFGFQSVLSVGFAARNAAVIAAEAGNASTADCSILRSIESDVSAPSSAQRISSVDIYWTDANGAIKSGSTTTYTRDTTQAMSCPINGVAATLPYAGPSPDGYAMASRCSVRSGCGGSHSGVDTVGVKITYSYAYHTPYGVVLGGPGWTVQRSSEMRMEPYQ